MKQAFSTGLASILVVLVVSCGYHFVGSRLLPFSSITIKAVVNETYEPRLEERMHMALANEFVNQGIEVKAAGGYVKLETVIKMFALGAIAAVDETVKEQEILMRVDLKLFGTDGVREFKDMQSPIKITYQSTGTINESVARKEEATDKACREIAREIVSRIIISYAK